MRGKNGLCPKATPEEFAATMVKCVSADPSGCFLRGRCQMKPSCFKVDRSDSDRYAELRALVEAWQNNRAGIGPLLDWRHR